MQIRIQLFFSIPGTDPDPGNQIDADPDPGSETITDPIPDPGHPLATKLEFLHEKYTVFKKYTYEGTNPF
jgi:hypothetical protein